MSTNQFVALHLPQSSPNDDYATIGEWTKEAEQEVSQGEVICLAETTKSVFEIESTADGYLMPVVSAGSEVQIGEIIAVITTEPVSQSAVTTWLQEQGQVQASHSPKSVPNWTAKAALVAQQHDIDVRHVPASGTKVTETDVLAYIKKQSADQPEIVNDFVTDRHPSNSIERLLILGGGNGAVQIIDTLQKIPHQQAVAIMDDDTARHGKQVAGVPIVGNIDLDRAQSMLADRLFDRAIISISTNISFRTQLFETWHGAGIPFANVIHPNTVIGMNISWGVGNVVMAFCHFGACAAIGQNNFLSAYCSIEHHCQLGNHNSFGPSVITSSSVLIGDRVRFGTGIFLEPRVQIGDDAVIASGNALWENVPANAIVKSKRAYTVRAR